MKTHPQHNPQTSDRIIAMWLVWLFSALAVYAQQPLGNGASSAHNYIQRTVLTQPMTAVPSHPTTAQAMRDITYFDGLGRPVQQVEVKASGGTGYLDMVTPMPYDAYGRQAYRYLPYATAVGSGGAYKSGAVAAQASYYAATPPEGLSSNTHPYSRSVYEPSPLERIREQGAPGQLWQPAPSRSGSSGRTVSVEYASNDTAPFSNTASMHRVTRYRVSLDGSLVPTLTADGVYPAGTLRVVITRDENWAGGSGTFTSRLHSTETYTDHLDRVVLVRRFHQQGELQQVLSTYYVYDPYGHLTFVLPAATLPDRDTGVPGPVELDQFGYRYRYDGRGRLVESRAPGQDWVYLIYGLNDRVLLSQDGRQRAAGGGKNWESRQGGTHYSNNCFPTSALTPLIREYYDDYGFDGASSPDMAPSGITPSQLTNSRQTGRLVYDDQGSEGLLSVFYYDDHGRVIQRVGQNHLGGMDHQTHTYTFSGELSSTVHTQSVAGGSSLTVKTTHSYDHRGRLLDTRKKVNTQPEYIQSRLAYNQIGQLRQKQLHSTNDGSSFAASVDYSYNERGWLTKSASSHFTQELRYNQPAAGATPQYNGNIAEQHWGHGTTTPNRFVYAYDALDRLISGISTTSGMSESMVYDNMGNITSLTRDGGTAITYSYSGNRLTALSGGISGSYSYDANGNALTDRNGLTYTYNHLNLPKTATKTGTSVSYTYDALGTKLRSVGAQSAGQTRDYVGAFEYTGGTLDRIHTEAGYVKMSGSSPEYHYYLRDHLGNVRSVFTPSGSSVTVVQQQDYYPYGLQKSLAGATQNLYLYNGKEIQGELGSQYDYGARFYDPEIGRWNVVDPLADSYYSWSPYNYTLGNPIKFIDPNGMFADYFDQDGNYLGNDGVDDDKIRIAPVRKSRYTSNYNTLPFNFYNRDGSVNRQAGMSMSRDISEIAIPDRHNVAEGILNFYFEQAGYSLSDLQSGKIDNTGPWTESMALAKMGGRTAGSSHLSDDAAAIEVSYGHLGTTLRNAADVKNLFVHEYGGHIGDLMKNPTMKVGPNRFLMENSATLLQLQHPTWRRVSPEFRSHIKTHQSRFLTDQQKRTYFP